uniref:Doublecortin domain-containing protein n=1 Tax=Globodera rostochiensis TaxID=31243 RepID=A0A914HVG1_GLORO
MDPAVSSSNCPGVDFVESAETAADITHPTAAAQPFLAVQRPNSAHKKRRRSQIVLNSLEGSLPVQLPTRARLFPNVPRPPAPVQAKHSNILPPPAVAGGQKAVPCRSLLAAADKNFRAKTIFFYRDGDEYFTGVRVPVSKARFRTMDALLDQLNESIHLPFGVRRLHTPFGMSPVSSLDDLKPYGKYVVASGARNVRGVDLEAMERRKRRREEAQRRWNFQQSSLGASHSSIQLQQIDQPPETAGNTADQKTKNQHRPRAPTLNNERSSNATKPQLQKMAPFVPITFRQVFFVLNGHPHRVYRALINPNRKGQLDQLLEEVSHGLQAAIFRMYSFDGDRILDIEQLLQLKDMRAVAVPRHEQLLLNGLSSYDNIVRPVRPVELGTDAFATLPPIPRAPKKTSRSSKSSSGASSSNIKDPTEFDQMKKRKKFQNEAEDGVPANCSGIAAVAATAGVIVRRRVRKAAEEVQIEAKDHRSTTGSSSHGQTQANATANSRVSADSDSGRPRTELDNELNAQKDEDRIKVEEAEEDEDEDEEEDDYPEEPEQLRSLRETEQERSRKRQRNKRKKVMKIDEEEAEAEEDDDAVFDHDGTGMETDHKSEKEDEEQSLEGMGQAVEDVQPVELTHRLEEADIDQKNETVDDQNGGVTVRINRTSSIQQKLGVYTDELERILYGEAAVKIQSAWRGYSTRKELQNNGLFRQKPRMMVNGGTVLHRHESKKDMYKTNDRHLAVIGPNPKSPIVPGTRTSRSSLQPYDNSTEELDSSSEREEVIHGTEFLTERKNETLNWDTNEPDPARVEQRKDPRGDAPYTVTVITGNRWAADTEANLYINMHGSNMDSEKLWLKQEFTDWLHSSAKGQRFRQNQSDSFAFRLPSRLGIINRITVGHERRGYGAGVFIDRILVTEDEVGGDGDEPMDDEHNANDCRQFLFLCNRWFDSGQVDGRLERSVRLSAFYMISSIPVDGRVTRGRWEFVLHGGTNDGRGGTTAQLAITGFGTDGQATTGGLYDTRMATAPSEALMQLDFGDIGELLKIRLEIDGAGSSPDYFLNFVEFKDLDTDERFVVMCGKWLRWRSAKKGDQPFRELLAFHIGVEPLPLITYDGKIRAFRSALSCFSAEQLCVELYGDLGDTGHVLVRVDAIGGEASVPKDAEKAEENDNNGRAAERTVAVDVPFKLEAVSVGRVSGVRVHFEPNAMGEQIFEGLITLQNIFQKQNVWPLSANSSFVLSQIRLHESTHTPYRYVLNRSHLRERVADQQQQTTTSLAKELLTTEMEGISTRLSKRKSQAKSVPSRWLLQMSVAEGSTILPEVMLCGEKQSITMTPVDNSLTDGILSFQLDNSTDFDDPFIKIRILSDGKTFLLAGTDQKQPENAEAEAGGSGELPFTYVDKVRMCDTANGDELRFPAADCMLLRHSVFELPVMWPDRPPIPILIYSVRVATGGSVGAEPSNPELIVLLNLFGELGDVGRRTLNPGDQQQQQQQSTAAGAGVSLFTPKTSSSFEFEATSIGDIRSAQLEVLTVPENTPFLWECAEIVVTDFRGRSAPFYAFKFASPFTDQCSVQRADVLPFTDAL